MNVGLLITGYVIAVVGAIWLGKTLTKAERKLHLPDWQVGCLGQVGAVVLVLAGLWFVLYACGFGK